MDPKHYLTVQRTFNRLHNHHDRAKDLTFEEFGILCLLYENRSLTATEIADHQGVSRPTMTHRSNRLAELGYIDRRPATDDRRKIILSNTREGNKVADEICTLLAAELPDSVLAPQSGESRVHSVRLMSIRMNQVGFSAGMLSLLAFVEIEEPDIIMRIVEVTGLLQPTVSMSISRLEKEGLVERVELPGSSKRTSHIGLTSDGREKFQELVSLVQSI